MWPHVRWGGNITYDKINSCVRKRANVAAFLVHLEVIVSKRWTHHTSFSLCDCSSLSWNEKRDGFVYACCIWAALVLCIHSHCVLWTREFASLCLRCGSVALLGFRIASISVCFNNERSRSPPSLRNCSCLYNFTAPYMMRQLSSPTNCCHKAHFCQIPSLLH